MNPSESDIHDYEASRLINKLYCLLGPANIDRRLEQYKRTLGLSGPIVSEYTIKHQHPWWNAFIAFFELKKAGKSIKHNLTPEIKMLAADAKRIITLKRFMPASVQNKYKRDLLDPERAFDYLFEIHIAWNFYIRGNELQWYEDGEKKHPEFLVKTPNFSFNVECKRISVDISRKVKREDFHRFAQKILPEISKQGYGGSVDVILNGRLDGGHINTLVSELVELIKSGNIRGEFEISLGTISLKLNEKSGKIVNMMEKVENLSTKDLHVAFLASRKIGNNFVDPIEISLKSEKPDKVLQGIYDKVYEAAKNQLNKSMPGIIICFLEEVYDLRDLSSNSGLQIMTCKLLNKEKFSHIAGIGYCSEVQIYRFGNSETYDHQALFFKNPNCKFEEVKEYQFVGNQMKQV
jgi:hypothetical protein